MKTAVAYARFSTDNQRIESIDAQLRAIREYANKNNISIIAEYTDEAQSATTDNRDSFQDMITASNTKNFDYVIVHKFDRFARDKYDHYYYEHKLNTKNIKLISVLEPFDDSPEAGLMKTLIIGMNEYFSKNLAREVFKGMKENALKAKFNGGTPPLGYDIDETNRYVINIKEAEIVKKIFQLFVEGFSYQEMADILNQQGHRTKRDTPFNRNSFTEMLRNEKYIGHYVFGINDSSGKTRNYHKKNPEHKIIKVENAIPAIVDKEVFDLVQNIRKNRKRIGGRKAKRPYLLTGILQCSCGSPMVGNARTNSVGKRYEYYWCNHRCGAKSIRADLLENQIIEILKKNLLYEDNINVLSRYAYNYIVNEETDHIISNIKKQLKTVNKQIKNIVDLVANTGSNSLINRLNELEKEKEELEHLIIAQNTKDISYETIKKEFMKFLSFDHLSHNEKKEILQIFIEKIKVDQDTISIHLRHIPSECVDSNGAGKRT